MGFPATSFDPFSRPVLVLGANGRIGRLLRQCWGGGSLRWQARARPADRLVDSPAGGGADWRILDPLNAPQALFEAAEGCRAILCLAGVTPGQPGDMEDNIRLGAAAIRAGAASGARVFLASSAAVYGRQAGLLREDRPLRPASPYGAAKARMEQEGAALAAGLGVQAVMLRIGNIAGLDAILGGWRAGFRLDRFADGRTPRRSYIGPRTLADVLAALIATPDLPGVINLAQPGAIAMGDLLRAAGRDFALRPAPDTAIPEVALDVTRLSALLPAELALDPADPAHMAAEWAALQRGSEG